MTDWRAIETRLAKFTLVGLAVYAPLETTASWQMFGGPAVLIHPGFLHSIAGAILLFAGAKHSLNARPRAAPALLCASHAWFAATFWHAATLRMNVVKAGDSLFYGSSELWVVIGGAALALLMFAISLTLTYTADSAAGRIPGAAARRETNTAAPT
jgi:hypothetical protein